MRKSILLTLSLAFLGMLPAMAQLPDQFQEQSLGRVLSDFTKYAKDLQDYLGNQTYPGNNYDNLPNSSRPVEAGIKDAIDYSAFYYRDEGKIPNPIAAGNHFREQVFDNSSGTFENNPAVQATIASNEINRQLTRGAVEGVLGENGQSRLKAKLENVEKSITDREKDVNQFQQQNQSFLSKFTDGVCQIAGNPGTGSTVDPCQNSREANLQLQSIRIQLDQSKMIGESLANTIQVNQSLQYSNLNLASISQQMEEANRARRVDASAEASRLLRATSQADLLGVRNQESGVTNQESQ